MSMHQFSDKFKTFFVDGFHEKNSGGGWKWMEVSVVNCADAEEENFPADKISPVFQITPCAHIYQNISWANASWRDF